MEHIFKSVWLHFEKSKRLFLNPVGDAERPEWGTVAVPPVIEVRLPCTKEALADAVQETFDNCYKLDWRSSPKEGPLGNYLKIRSQRKFVQLFYYRLILDWNIEKKYCLDIWKRNKQGKGYYDDHEHVEFGEEIDYDYLLNLIQ